MDQTSQQSETQTAARKRGILGAIIATLRAISAGIDRLLSMIFGLVIAGGLAIILSPATVFVVYGMTQSWIWAVLALPGSIIGLALAGGVFGLFCPGAMLKILNTFEGGGYGGGGEGLLNLGEGGDGGD